MDQHQYAYRENRPTEEAFTPALLTALTHLGKKGTYARLHFIDYSSAFNTIIPNQLLTKPLHLAVNNNLCKWIRHFLKDRPETASLGPHQPSSLSLSAGAPQGCVEPAALLHLHIRLHPTHPTNSDYVCTAVVGQISDNKENAYEDESAA